MPDTGPPLSPRADEASNHVWERRLTELLRAAGLNGVRRTFLALAVLATLIPALATGWLSYRQNRRAIVDKVEEELQAVSNQTSRELSLWLKERLYDARVFASSYEVSENLERAGPAGARRLTDYLTSVKDRFPDYEEILVMRPEGRVVASSAASPGTVHLAGDWMAALRTSDATLGEPRRADSLSTAVMELAVPIMATSGRFVGALATRVNFTGVEQLLSGFAPTAGRLYVVNREGTVLAAASADPTGVALPWQIAPETVELLEAAGGVALSFRGPEGRTQVGALGEVPRTSWLVVATIPRDVAFVQIAELRNRTTVTVLVLLLLVGGLAYALSLLIVRPLERLGKAAAEVADGQLDVNVPVIGNGELAYVTGVFNGMVDRLRRSRRELERLSVTDALTGLANRRHLMEELTKETGRGERHDRQFSVLMIDVDHFKQFNDTHGHQAGDEALQRIARVLTEAVRQVDTVARYGGEEFFVILPETSAQEAAAVTDRIRAKLSEASFPSDDDEAGAITLSIGVAEFPRDGETPDTLIAAADQALYGAKHQGRDRVVSGRTTPPKTKKPKR